MMPHSFSAPQLNMAKGGVTAEVVAGPEIRATGAAAAPQISANGAAAQEEARKECFWILLVLFVQKQYEKPHVQVLEPAKAHDLEAQQSCPTFTRPDNP